MLDLRADGPEAEEFVVDTDNWDALSVFRACGTQWRYTMAGVVGLDYSAVIDYIGLYGIKKKDRLELFEKVQLIEHGALLELRKDDDEGE